MTENERNQLLSQLQKEIEQDKPISDFIMSITNEMDRQSFWKWMKLKYQQTDPCIYIAEPLPPLEKFTNQAYCIMREKQDYQALTAEQQEEYDKRLLSAMKARYRTIVRVRQHLKTLPFCHCLDEKDVDWNLFCQTSKW